MFCVYMFLSLEYQQVIYNVVKVCSFVTKTDKKKLRIALLKYIANYPAQPMAAHT
jgi:hypothetical protein